MHALKLEILHKHTKIEVFFNYFKYTETVVGRNNSVGTATRYEMDGSGGSNPGGGGDIIRILTNRTWGPPSFLYKKYWVFPGGKTHVVWR